MTTGMTLAILGGVLSVVLGGFGSIIAVGRAGKAASAVITEEPEKFGKALILEALPGTQGIYGFLVGIMLFQKVGILGGTPEELTIELGWYFFFVCLAAALTGFLSAIFQGKVCNSGMQVLAKKPAEVTKAIILAAMVETYAVLGLLISILLINGVQLS